MDEELQHFLSLLTKGERTYRIERGTRGDDPNATFVLYNESNVDIYRCYDQKALMLEQVCLQLGVPHK